jgi:hypothetical protein
VEPDRLPAGLTQKDAMKIARMKTAEEQRAALARYDGLDRYHGAAAAK